MRDNEFPVRWYIGVRQEKLGRVVPGVRPIRGFKRCAADALQSSEITAHKERLYATTVASCFGLVDELRRSSLLQRLPPIEPAARVFSSKELESILPRHLLQNGPGWRSVLLMAPRRSCACSPRPGQSARRRDGSYGRSLHGHGVSHRRESPLLAFLQNRTPAC